MAISNILNGESGSDVRTSLNEAIDFINALGSPTTVGVNFLTLSNPSAIAFVRINADNSISSLSASDFKTALSLNNVENVAISTWTGSANITTLGTIASGTWNGTAIAVANGGTGATDASTARTNLGLAIGTNVQAYSSTLAAVAGGTYTGATSITTLGTIATGVWNGTAIAVANGGTGATTAATARTNLGLAIGSDVQAYNSSLAAIAAGTWTGASSITTVGTLSSLTSSGAITSAQSSLGTSLTNGFVSSNSTAAANGAQQMSPVFRFKGFGYASTGGTSQAVEVANYLLPVQGTSSPSFQHIWSYAISGGSNTPWMCLTNSNTTFGARLTLGGVEGGNNTGIITGGAGGVFMGRGDQAANQTFTGYSGAYLFTLSSDTRLGWSSSAAGSATDIRAQDTWMARKSTGTIGFGTATATPVNYTLCGNDGSGSNITGGTLTFAAGNGTGTGGSGPINLQTAATGSSGSTANTLRTVLQVKADGSLDSPTMTVEAAVATASTNKLTFYVNGTRYKLLAIQE